MFQRFVEWYHTLCQFANLGITCHCLSNHSLSSTASQGTSNIPFPWFLLLGSHVYHHSVNQEPAVGLTKRKQKKKHYSWDMTIKRFVFGSIAICGTLVIEVFNSCHSRFYQWFYNYFWRSRICWQEVRDVIKQLSHEQSISFSFFVISVLALHFFLTDPRLALTQHSISYHLSYHWS